MLPIVDADMGEGPGRSRRGLPGLAPPPASTPAGPRTLRLWRRIGLVFGVPAAVLVVAAVVLRVVDGRGSAWHLLLVVPGLLAGLVAVVFLRRVWSEPEHPRTALSVLGQRLSSAFLGLWGLGIVARWIGLPPWFLTVVAVGWGAALVATVGVALQERPVHVPD